MARSMPKGGGGGSVDWVALAESNPVVMFRYTERMKDFEGRGGATPQVRLDMAVLTGPQAGRVVRGESVIGKGITNEIIKHEVGADIPVRLTVLNSYGNDYCATQSPSDPEMKVVDKLFPEGKEDQSWAKASEAWAKKAPAEEEKVAASVGASDSDDGDDAPW